MISPAIQITKVLVTSIIDLANADTCFVTATPEMLNPEIVNIAKIHENSNNPNHKKKTIIANLNKILFWILNCRI